MLNPRFTIFSLTGLLLMLSGQATAQSEARHNPGMQLLHVEDSFSFSDSHHVFVENHIEFRKWASGNVRIVFKARAGLDNIYWISGASKDDLKRLLQVPGVRFLEKANRKPTTESSVPGLDLSMNTVTTVQHAFPELDGENMKVSVKENAFDKDDIDLRGRAFNADAFPSEHDPHATVMATIISGAGNSSPEGKGVAWKASPGFSDFTNLLPDPTSALMNDGVIVQNHSYGVGVENYYGVEAHAYDRQSAEYPSLVHVFSAGNSGTEPAGSGPFEGIAGYANLTGEFKNSKNTIAVGGVDGEGVVEAASSRGPTAGGRIKPEVVAYGNGGTSEAAAIVSGIALLMQQRHRNLTDSLPHSSLIRAALFNSADDAGSPEVDFEYGFGIADALGAVETISEQRFFYGAVPEGGGRSFLIDVPADIPLLKVTLAWIDPPSDPGSEGSLINDLDLRVYDVSGMQHQPWVLNSYPQVDSLRQDARRGEDHINNVEQVTIRNPVAGQYVLEVRGYDIPSGAQAFYVVYEISPPFKWTFPASSDALEADREYYLRWKWNGEDTPVTIHWSVEGSDLWTTAGDANMSQGYFSWRTPDVDDIVALRLHAGDKIMSVESFVVSHRAQVDLGYNCPDDAMLFWRHGGTDVNSFMLHKLSGSFLDEGMLVEDTVAYIEKEAGQADYYAVTPLVGGRSGVRSRGVAFYDDLGDCYVSQFLARELVSDSVILDVLLTTNYGLKSVSLERDSPQGFEVLQTLSPVMSTAYELFDGQPEHGRNRYRMRIERTNGDVFYSQNEDVWYTDSNDLVLFPNPLLRGEVLNVIVENDPVTLRLYNPAGVLVGESLVDGEIKLIDTSLLDAGIFFLRAVTDSGQILTGKIVVK